MTPRRLLLVALLCALSSPASAEELRCEVACPTPLWWATQLVPSPAIASGDDTSFALRWQLTPLLYGWGVNSRVSGWRAFVVEPNVRHGGSIELFISPELIFHDDTLIIMRPGLRAYLPLIERGESLSASLAVSHQRVDRVDAAAVELGIYALFGILGLQASWAPGPKTPAQTMFTLRLRYF